LNKKLKIAIYSGQIPSTTFIESLVTAIAEHHEVLLFGTQNKSINYANKNIRLYKTPKNNWLKLVYNFWRSLLLGLKNPKELITLFKIVSTNKTTYQKWQNYSKLLPLVLYQPDILHLQWAKNLEDFIVLKTYYKIPVVLSLRGAHINYSPLVSGSLANSYRENFPKISAFHAVSKAIVNEAKKYNVVTEKTHIIYSVIPDLFIDAYEPLKQKKHQTIKILSVGRPHWIKGYTYIIKALAELKNLGYKFQYQIVGIDKPDDELLFLIDALDLKRNVILQKSVSQPELIKLMKTQDVMLLGSLAEGIANVVLEAMAIGLPVISTDCGGMNEVVISGETGFLVSTRNEKAITKALIDFYHMPYNQLQIQTQNAHNLIKEKFNREKSVTQFLELYNSIDH
tara:strand:+ start:8902 stop:10092 length:1191 start_codon:yes stop_codon:yes gene_type:complete